MRWLTNFYDFRLKFTGTVAIGIHPTKAWISKIQSGREDTLEERYAIKFSFKLGKNASETYAWVEHQFLSGIRDSRKVGILWGMMRGVGRVSKTIHQSWLAKGLRLWLLCWGLKGIQEEIPWEESSTLQIGSVAFPPGQWTSPQLHPCHRLFDQDGHQHSSSPSLESRPCSLWLLVISWALTVSLWNNWGDERGCDEGHWHAHTKGLPWGLPGDVGTVQQVHCSWRRLLRIWLEFHVYTIKCPYEKSLETYLMILVYI